MNNNNIICILGTRGFGRGWEFRIAQVNSIDIVTVEAALPLSGCAGKRVNRNKVREIFQHSEVYTIFLQAKAEARKKVNMARPALLTIQALGFPKSYFPASDSRRASWQRKRARARLQKSNASFYEVDESLSIWIPQ